MRIELTYAAWKAAVLPFNYTRSGVSEATRTLDPLIKSQLLCHLSYRDGSKIYQARHCRADKASGGEGRFRTAEPGGI